MGGSLEAFKLFNARWEKNSSQSTATTTTTTTTASSNTSEAASNKPSVRTPSSNNSEASNDNTSVFTPVSNPETTPENGFKICVANVENYSRQQQNNAVIQERLAELNRK